MSSINTHVGNVLLGDIKLAYRRLLEIDKRFATSSIVAGGCLRDADHNKAYKDIDIFVPVKNWTTDELHSLSKNLRASKCNTRMVKGYDDNNLDVYEFHDKIRNKHPVQVILHHDVASKNAITSTFNNALSRIYFDPRQKKVYKMKSYIEAVNYKTNRYLKNSRQKYIAKITERYPEYYHVIMS